MKKHIIVLFLSCLCILFLNVCRAQNDSIQSPALSDTIPAPVTVDSMNKVATPIVQNRSAVDSVFRNHSPRKATIRSAILPGWGQAYNRRYWKIPIIYGALVTTGVVFVYNLNTYKELRFAYKARIEAEGRLGPPDSTNYKTLQEIYKVLDVNAIQTYRNEYRRNIDFSALVFLLFWGLNVVDATVDAHLRTFDVSPDLSFHIRAGYSDMSNTAGLRFILAFK